MSTKIATERNRRVPIADPEVIVEDSGVSIDSIWNGALQQNQGTIFARFRRGLAKRMSIGGSSAQVAMAQDDDYHWWLKHYLDSEIKDLRNKGGIIDALKRDPLSPLH